jgi:CHAT domain-containing protein
MVQQAERLEERVSVLRLREAVAPDLAGPASQPVPSAPAEPGIAELELHVAGEDLVLFDSNGPDRSAVRVRGALPSVTALLDRLGDQWTRFLLGSVFSVRHSDLLLRTAQSVLQQLYDVLLGPVADQLAGDAELRIVPHRLLHQVPFGALYDGQRYLIERRPVTILPSPNVWGTARPVTPDLSSALVVAYADEAAPAVQPEADMVADVLPAADRLVGEAATSDAFVAAAPHHGLVHLACHGQFRRSNPLFSRLRFADRWLTAAEVLPLDLAGALVVLSACESGQLGEAAEPVGLGWAFLAAGASGVVVSQWRVSDDATRELMGSFYRALVAGVPPAYALRSAQLRTAARHPHPFYWAPFSYLASPASPDPTSNSPEPLRRDV